jgi:hypothetical protein
MLIMWEIGIYFFDEGVDTGVEVALDEDQSAGKMVFEGIPHGSGVIGRWLLRLDSSGSVRDR